MSRLLFYAEEAEEDIKLAFDFYTRERDSLGDYFLDSLQYAENVILKNSEGFQVRYFDKIRAYPLKKFPFLLFYVVKNDSIYVLAVFNTNQNPTLLNRRFK
jgi:hypothetical protein